MMHKINSTISGILARHASLIKVYLSDKVSTSSDGIGCQDMLQSWQNVLYSNLSTFFDDGSAPSAVGASRYAELERLMLGLIFAHAVYDYDDWGRAFIDSCSNDEPLREESVRIIQSMMPAKTSIKPSSIIEYSAPNTVFEEALQQSNASEPHVSHPLFDIEGHFILSDITKSHAVIDKLKTHYASTHDTTDSFEFDHDLAYQYLMDLDSMLIKEMIGVDVPDRVLHYSQQVRCPLHLGHASQAECHWRKIHHCKLALADRTDKDTLLNRVFLVQYFDIAGARAHKTGLLFLKNAIFSNYNALHQYLGVLFDSGNSDESTTKASYSRYLCSPIDDILQQPGADDLSAFVGLLRENPRCFDYFVMFAWQFRFLEEDNRIDRLTILAKACHALFQSQSVSSGFWMLDPVVESLQVILKEMQDHETPTYVPSVYQTLRCMVWPEITKAGSPNCQLIIDHFDNDIAFTLQVGLQLIAKGIQYHRQVALSHDPCCFNHINRQLQENPSDAIAFLELLRSDADCPLQVNESNQLLLTTSDDCIKNSLTKSC